MSKEHQKMLYFIAHMHASNKGKLEEINFSKSKKYSQIRDSFENVHDFLKYANKQQYA